MIQKDLLSIRAILSVQAAPPVEDFPAGSRKQMISWQMTGS